jgi:hypothetical protein
VLLGLSACVKSLDMRSVAPGYMAIKKQIFSKRGITCAAGVAELQPNFYEEVFLTLGDEYRVLGEEKFHRSREIKGKWFVGPLSRRIHKNSSYYVHLVGGSKCLENVPNYKKIWREQVNSNASYLMLNNGIFLYIPRENLLFYAVND